MKKIVFPILAGLFVLWAGVVHAGPEGTLNICQGTAEPLTLDPHMHHDVETEDIIRQLCEHLVDRDANGRLIPALATGWNLIDKTTWQFKLRRGVRFHNGENFDAKAVKFSIERIIDPKGESPQRRLYESIEHVDIIDDYTVNIVTKEIDVLLPGRLSLFANIVPMGYLKEVGESEFAKRPIGTGPFKFFKWEKGKAIVLIANDSYFNGPPKIRKLIFKFIADQKERVKMLLEGEVDILTNIMPHYRAKLKEDKRIKLLQKANIQFVSVMFNTLGENVFTDRRVRQALNYATDVDKLIRYVRKGMGRRLATFTMPEEFGYNPDLRPYPFDIDKAKKLLKEAGYPDGFKIKMLAMESISALAPALKKQWAKIGVKVELSCISRADAISKALIKKGIPFDIFIGDPIAPLLDASLQMTLHLDPKHPISKFHNDQISELLYKSYETMDTQRRLAILQKIQEIVYEEAPLVFLYQNITLYGVRANVKGFEPYADAMLRLYNVSKED
ncbi:MAG: hypothetical protein HY739_04745 [Desulfobacterales bacterium]|nr:hypothetical protein [Desulfobacterales bacterium]